VGICVTQFDPKQLERGILCSPGAMSVVFAGIVAVEKIPYYKSSINSKAKFHITVGYETIMAKVSFFGLSDPQQNGALQLSDFDFSREYANQDELFDLHEESRKSDSAEGVENSGNLRPTKQFALLEFERPVTCSDNSLVIGSKLDTDIHSNVCRIAFSGRMVEAIKDPKYTENVLPKVKVFKNKCKEGVVERKSDDYTVICHGTFKRETNMDLFTGLRVQLSTGEQGVIEGGFGQSGKFKVRISGNQEIHTLKTMYCSIIKLQS
jgi:selenocysteine-specific elongation factor